MKSKSIVIPAKNLLISAGAYYIAAWLTFPLSIGFGRLTSGIIYRGDFNGTVVMPLVEHLPRAIVATAAGAAVIFLVESDRPMRWAFILAAFYALLGFLGYHWGEPPMIMDRISQAIGALFPAATCVVGALLAARRRMSTPKSVAE